MHYTSWYHCSKDTSILPAIASLLKVFIQGVPSHNPMASVFIRHPTSSLSWAGAGGQKGCPVGSYPPPGWVGAGVKSGCPVGSHSLLLGNVTS